MRSERTIWGHVARYPKGKDNSASSPVRSNRWYNAREMWPNLKLSPAKQIVQSNDRMKFYQVTYNDGGEVNWVHEVGQESALQSKHIPLEDLVTTGHGTQPTAKLQTNPGLDAAFLYRNRTFAYTDG